MPKKKKKFSVKTVYVAIRHGCDDFDHTIYKHEHDTPLCSIDEHKKEPIDSLVHKLLDKEFLPDFILTSPFLRCQETSKLILDKLQQITHKKVPLYIDVNLSRFFFSKEKQNPDIDKKTAQFKVPIFESRKEFTKRIQKHLWQIQKEHPGKIIWTITHGMVCYEIMKLLDDHARKYSRFLETYPILLG